MSNWAQAITKALGGAGDVSVWTVTARKVPGKK